MKFYPYKKDGGGGQKRFWGKKMLKPLEEDFEGFVTGASDSLGPRFSR